MDRSLDEIINERPVSTIPDGTKNCVTDPAHRAVHRAEEVHEEEQGEEEEEAVSAETVALHPGRGITTRAHHETA